MRFFGILAAAAMLTGPGAASAKILEAGAGKTYNLPSAAIAAAASGDTVRIAPGRYFDCAIVPQDNITIEGVGPDVILTDKTCAGKALLVIDGNNVTIRNMTLQRARVPDHNGAGIRAEGGDLTIENTRFINNENGILGADNPTAAIRITGSAFIGNGRCMGTCSHGIYIGVFKLLHIDHTTIRDTHEGHGVKSRALRTEVIDSVIEDGPTGTSSYLIEVPNGGSLIVENCTLEKGQLSQNQGNTIMIGAEGVTQMTDEIIIKGNRFTNSQNRGTLFVTNLTATPAQVTGNVFKGTVTPLQGDGAVH